MKDTVELLHLEEAIPGRRTPSPDAPVSGIRDFPKLQTPYLAALQKQSPNDDGRGYHNQKYVVIQFLSLMTAHVPQRGDSRASVCPDLATTRRPSDDLTQRSLSRACPKDGSHTSTQRAGSIITTPKSAL